MNDTEYSYFQRKVLALTGIDLSLYKSEQMKRRLATIMARTGAHGLYEYSRMISQDPVKLRQFRDFVTINVSEFFRIPDKFEYLQRQMLPAMLSAQPRLNVWSAGCSNGAEPYTLAIILQELAPLGQWRIMATDIDATVLEQARRGIYSAADVRNVRSDLLRKYFVAKGDQFQVVDCTKNRVSFKIHDLLRDEYGKNCDLIVCRHVLIYFTEDAKDEIFRRFQASLRPGGVLFLGGTEMIRRPKDIGLESLAVSFYRKTTTDRPAEEAPRMVAQAR